MNGPRWSRFAWPVALTAFAVVAAVDFRELPAEVPIHFTTAGTPDRWLAPRPFIALQVTLALGLTGMMALVRWVLAMPEYDAEGAYRREPRRRARALVAVDCVGAAGVLVVAWTAHLCAEASRTAQPETDRHAILIPWAVVLLGALASAWWVRRDSRAAAGR